MRTTRILALSAATALAMAAPSGTAHAGPGDAGDAGISVAPAQTRPGTTVEIRVDCSDFADPLPGGVSSPGFEQGTVELRAAGADGHYQARATAVAQPGTYGVDGNCLGDQGTDGSRFVAELTVAGKPASSPAPDPAGGTAEPAESEPSEPAESVEPAPVAPVEPAPVAPVEPSEPVQPSGKVDAGHGPGSSPGVGTLAGVATALAGVSGGLWLLRRRGAESDG
jgi:hypothetical protein